MTAQEYFAQHSLDETFVTKTLGWAFDETQIAIPIYSESGKLLYSKIRHLEGDIKFTYDPPKGNKAAIYCLHKIKRYNKIVLCEGEPDAARLWQAGIPAVTTTSGAQSFSKENAEALAGHEVIVVFDNDDAGKKGLLNAITLLDAAGIVSSALFLPTGYKDVCEFFYDGNTTEDFWNCETVPGDEFLEANEPEEFKLISGVELLSKKLPKEAWLIDRIVPSEGIVMFAGAEATLKSFYTITIADALQTGFSWLGKFEVKKKTNVLFIDKENTQRRVQTRMKNMGIEGKNMWWINYPQYFQLAKDGGFSEFALSVSRKVKKNDIGLIIIDSFTDVMIGNENAAADVQVFFDAVRQLFSNRAVLVLHHENKAQAGDTKTSAQKTRGSTNINAQIVVGFRTAEVPKEKGSYSIEQTKAGDAEKLTKFKVKTVIEPDPEDPTKTIVVSLKHEGDIIEQEEKNSLARSFIEGEFQKKDGIPRKVLIELCTANGISKRSMSNVISELKAEGYITSEKRPGSIHEVIYQWVEDPEENNTIQLSL